MLRPVPGYSQLQLWEPAAVEVDKRTTAARSSPPQGRPAPLVHMALEAAFGARPVSSLPPQRFSSVVRAQLNARRRTHPGRSTIKVLTYHFREPGEIFGTAEAEKRIITYTAVYAERQITSFRVF